MKKPYEGLNGIERNIAKLGYEWRRLKDDMGEHVIRFAKKPWDVHAYTNLFVESARSQPYFMGHVYAIALPIVVLLLVLT